MTTIQKHLKSLQSWITRFNFYIQLIELNTFNCHFGTLILHRSFPFSSTLQYTPYQSSFHPLSSISLLPLSPKDYIGRLRNSATHTFLWASSLPSLLNYLRPPCPSTFPYPALFSSSVPFHLWLSPLHCSFSA